MVILCSVNSWCDRRTGVCFVMRRSTFERNIVKTCVFVRSRESAYSSLPMNEIRTFERFRVAAIFEAFLVRIRFAIIIREASIGRAERSERLISSESKVRVSTRSRMRKRSDQRHVQKKTLRKWKTTEEVAVEIVAVVPRIETCNDEKAARVCHMRRCQGRVIIVVVWWFLTMQWFRVAT